MSNQRSQTPSAAQCIYLSGLTLHTCEQYIDFMSECDGNVGPLRWLAPLYIPNTSPY